jgi:Carboxypeptidase regulatory-like domain
MHPLWRKSLLLSALALTAAASVPTHADGQQLSETRGGLSGVITDKSGAFIPDAKVTVAGAADTRVLTTDAGGRFTASDLTPGLYTVTVEKAGFQRQTAKNLEVVINKNSTVDFSLATGNVAETVEVNATTLSIDTSSTAVSDNLTATFYQQVPVARNIGSLFYVSPGVVDGGGTGQSNPSVGGATGLENLYLVDGVVLNDSGYGGLGVFSPIYGSLGTGINLSFIQEVQVKTAAYEPKYGGVNGGVLQIVTKSGGSQLHGAIAAYAAPEWASAGSKYQDNFRLAYPESFQRGKIFSQPAYDASIELGGFIPIKGQHDRLFFFGSFNPSLNQVNFLAPNTAFAAAVYAHGPYTSSATTRSWAGKLSLKLTEGTTLDASAFGDPAHNNYTYNAPFAEPYHDYNINLRNTTSFSTWQYGSRAIVTHLASSLNPTTQMNLAVTYKTSGFTEGGFANVFGITDKTVGSTGFQGLGFYQNPQNTSYGTNLDLQKLVDMHRYGSHTFSVGLGFNRAIYKLYKDYSGGHFNFPTTNAAGTPIQEVGGNDALAGASTDAAFYLTKASVDKNTGVSPCPPTLCPYYQTENGPVQVYLRQVRGLFSGNQATSNSSYLSGYVNDSFAIGRRVTLNAGIRWEEEQLNGPNQQYVFNDNWSPRFGINIDPFADRKTKVYFNWGRYTQTLPTDAAIRELNQELDVTARWAAPSDGHNLVTDANGLITPTLDSAHLLSGIQSLGPGQSNNITASAATPELIHSGTKLNFEEEYLLGVQREIAGGMVLDIRYSDRRLQRIVEDMQGISPEGANFGLANQIYLIGNPSPSSDYFINEQEEPYTPIVASDGSWTGAPANCVADYGPQYDSLGNLIGAACGQNPDTAGLTTPDGKPDGFATPVRRYQSFEVSLNKNFSRGFLIHANYRFAKLWGNYEGLFRNDNGQSDPGISSLFDFTQGVIGLLGAQFQPGYLNTDRRNVGNLYGSYTLPGGRFRKLTGGIGLRGQTGNPISRLASHPVYQNVGEIPIGGRGTAGTNPTNVQLDTHLDYPISFGERGTLKLAFDGFNVTNSQFTRSVNQNIDTGFQTGADPTFRTPIDFQRAFYGRFSVRYEF